MDLMNELMGLAVPKVSSLMGPDKNADLFIRASFIGIFAGLSFLLKDLNNIKKEEKVNGTNE